jgi:5-methylcytosine-specific restriction endonuclease McrA
MSACLILNGDISPVSLLPLSTIPWQESIKYLINDRATVLEWHDDWIVRSERWSTKVPAVMILKEYHRNKTIVKFTKQNVFLRDMYECQYCGVGVTPNSATLDHIMPTCAGGRTTWDNCCCSCGKCNSYKGNDTRIKPNNTPYKPTYYDLAEKKRKLGWDFVHPSWEEYIRDPV